jgi:lipopolysaccharide transport system ATP-binding protein
MDRAEVVERMGRILHLSGLQDSLDVPLGTLSSGMQVRLGFAVAAAAEPQVLLVDEILSFGDRAFGEQSMETLKQISQHAGILIVSHNLELIQSICTDVIVMEQGRTVFSSTDVKAGVEHYNALVSADKSLK